MDDLIRLAETIAVRLKARRESIAIAESSTGGLISAALLALPGASAYFLGGAVAYTRPSKMILLGLDEKALAQFRPATEGHALFACARRAGALCPQRGVLERPARPDRRATATAIRLATLAWRLPAAWSDP
jgi:nicotinamide-nucleotide amidase